LKPETLNIAVLLPHTRTYGGVRRYVEMGNQFVRRGYDYTIHTPDGRPPDWIQYNGKVARLDDMNDEPDVLICGDVGMMPRFAEMTARLKIMNLLGSRFADKYRRYYREDMIVVGNSIEWKHYFPGVEGYTIAGAVNTDIFRPMRKKEAGGGQYKVMCFGRMSKKYKGVRFVIDAVRRLKPRSDYVLVMFDNEPLKKPRGINVETHHGLTQQELATLYNTADVFVSAEYGAGWSNTSAEAMACGVPVICTDSGTQDFAVDGETALLVPHGDPAAIAEKITAKGVRPLLLLNRLAENGLHKIREFTWPRLCDRFEALFRKHL
jgi:glycosyltransferase involved in cell wall biosynthesis